MTLCMPTSQFDRLSHSKNSAQIYTLLSPPANTAACLSVIRSSSFLLVSVVKVLEFVQFLTKQGEFTKSSLSIVMHTSQKFEGVHVPASMGERHVREKLGVCKQLVVIMCMIYRNLIVLCLKTPGDLYFASHESGKIPLRISFDYRPAYTNYERNSLNTLTGILQCTGTWLLQIT